MTNPPDTTARSEPIRSFSHCHDGIVAQLRRLDELPALLEPAARARTVAADTLRLVRDVVFEHHAEEERELFPAVLASAAKGEERDRVKDVVEQLTREHRRVEAEFEKLEPKLKAIAKGHQTDVDVVAIEAVVAEYLAHAKFEEEVFLPLAQQILGRNSDHMAALGLSLHARHTLKGLKGHDGFHY